jgi:hypothetical protein
MQRTSKDQRKPRVRSGEAGEGAAPCLVCPPRVSSPAPSSSNTAGRGAKDAGRRRQLIYSLPARPQQPAGMAARGGAVV